MKTYDVNYFISFFSGIHEDLWYIGHYFNKDKSKFCALGHCQQNQIQCALGQIFNDYGLCVVPVNDGFWGLTSSDKIIKYSKSSEYWKFPTPKQRILAALYDIKKMQEDEEQKTTYKTVLVEIDNKVKDLTKEELIMN